MGIRSIMKARRIVLIASGTHKAEIVKRAFFGPVTPQVPASVLQLHNNVILVGDEEALALI
jgi:glucosamine-6-phosphate deaminase